jgi:hypothetical protein
MGTGNDVKGTVLAFRMLDMKGSRLLQGYTDSSLLTLYYGSLVPRFP